jgi:hypothetical protein
MAVLSFTRGRPIAYIKDGEYDGEILHIYDPEKEICTCNKRGKKKGDCPKCDFDEDEMEDRINMDPFDYIPISKMKRPHKRMSVLTMMNLRDALKKKQRPAEDDLGELYDEGRGMIEDKLNRELKLYDGKIIPLPRIDGSERIYIAGPTESGKSTYAHDFIREYLKIYPKNKFYLFSRLKNDDVLDDLKPKRVKIDERMITQPIQPSEMDNSIVLFDDIDTIPDKKIAEATRKLRDDLLETGRHENITTVSTAHQLMNYKSSRTLLNESSSITFFPRSGSSYHIDRLLKIYCGLGKKDIYTIMNLPSRWVTIHKNYPLYVLYEKGAFLIGKK